MKGIEQVRICENGTIDGKGGLWHAKKIAIPAPHNKPEQLVLNIDDFGAKAGGILDNSQAFEKAWDKGCNSMESAKIMVPKERLIMLSMSILQALAISLFLWSIRGTIKSFPQMYDFPKRLWIKFEDVTNIDVFGGGTIDGNGQVWWNNSCKIMKTKTLFDLQEISAKIREKTSHLPGVSIAIMGCIVNDPGEMADADFGYVGGAPGKIDLYVGKATDALINLIKEHVGRCGYGVFGAIINGGDVAAASNLYQDGVGYGACYQVRCTNSNYCSEKGVTIVITDHGSGHDTDFILSRRSFGFIKQHISNSDGIHVTRTSNIEILESAITTADLQLLNLPADIVISSESSCMIAEYKLRSVPPQLVFEIIPK
ncbi:hypothetical protein ACS0TY_021456 [Phlomoides rotata]